MTIREDDQPLSQTETQTLKDNLLVGKNSISRAEAQFMNRVMVRNRNTFFNGGQAQSTQPKLSFHNLAVDWNDKQEKLDALFSIDDLSSDKKRNISWETSISHSKNESGVKNTSVSTALNFSHRLSDNMMFGYILGFGYSDTTMTGTITGTNLGRSGSIGLYTSYKIQDSLIFDLMASKTFEKNELNSQIGNKFIEGEYDRNSSSLSSSLQGVYKFTNFEFRPTISYTIGKSLFNNAYFDITQSGLTSSQQIDFGSDEYFSLSFEPELKMLIGDKKQLLRPTGFNLMKIRPKYFCEKYNSEAVESCGEGLGITFANHHPKYFYNQDLTLDYEKISDTTTYAVRYKRTY